MFRILVKFRSSPATSLEVSLIQLGLQMWLQILLAQSFLLGSSPFSDSCKTYEKSLSHYIANKMLAVKRYARNLQNGKELGERSVVLFLTYKCR